MALYTRFGDSGETMLYGGAKTSKTNPRIHACGTVDELDAILGMIRTSPECSEPLKSELLEMQRQLYRFKADLATPHTGRQGGVRMTDTDVETLEKKIDAAEAKVPALRHFIVQGGTRVAAELHYARTVCRRAERWVVQLAHCEQINFAALRFMNRLSDYLFALARVVNAEGGKEEIQIAS